MNTITATMVVVGLKTYFHVKREIKWLVVLCLNACSRVTLKQLCNAKTLAILSKLLLSQLQK